MSPLFLCPSINFCWTVWMSCLEYHHYIAWLLNVEGFRCMNCGQVGYRKVIVQGLTFYSWLLGSSAWGIQWYFCFYSIFCKRIARGIFTLFKLCFWNCTSSLVWLSCNIQTEVCLSLSIIYNVAAWLLIVVVLMCVYYRQNSPIWTLLVDLWLCWKRPMLCQSIINIFRYTFCLCLIKY